MRVLLSAVLLCVIAALPSHAQDTALPVRPRVELPITFVLEPTLLPASRMVHVGPGGVVTVTQQPGGLRFYSRRAVRFDASLTLRACSPGLGLSPVGSPLGRLRTDSTWVFRLAPLGMRCVVPPTASPPSR